MKTIGPLVQAEREREREREVGDPTIDQTPGLDRYRRGSHSHYTPGLAARMPQHCHTFPPELP